MGVHSMIQFDLLTDLKNYDVSHWTTDSLQSSALLADVITPGDGKGGLYRWDPTSNASEDLTFMGVIASNSTPTGRWVRTFQRVRTVPQGVLVYNGDVKILYVTATTNSSGEASINLTYDNTSNGTAIFSTIYKNDSKARTTATGPGDSVTSYLKVPAENTAYKTTTHGYFKANAVTVTLGLLIQPLASVGAGVTVLFEVVGI